MTTVQPPRHRAPAGARGFGREPHPSGPITVTPRPLRTRAVASVGEPPTVPITRAALDAARAPRPVPTTAPVAPRNGLGIAGLVLGLCGLVVGLIPLFGMGAILLGVVGLVLGLVGVTRARRGAATNTKTAVTGVVACLLAIALGIYGCVVVVGAVNQLGEDLSSVGASTPAAAPASAPATSAVGFGQTFTYADGLAVTVDQPSTFRASSTAAGDTNPHAFSTTVRITNNTGAAFDPTLLSVSMTTAGAPASSIIDSARGVNGFAPQNQLQPGRSMTYEVAFSTTANSGEAQIDVVPSFQHDHAVFTGTL